MIYVFTFTCFAFCVFALRFCVFFLLLVDEKSTNKKRAKFSSNCKNYSKIGAIVLGSLQVGETPPSRFDHGSLYRPMINGRIQLDATSPDRKGPTSGSHRPTRGLSALVRALFKSRTWCLRYLTVPQYDLTGVIYGHAPTVDHIHVNWTEASATQRAFYCRPLGLLPRPIPRFSRSHQPQECRQALKKASIYRVGLRGHS